MMSPEHTPPPRQKSRRDETRRYARLSITAALATITLKLCAWWVSGSVGLLSDALESFVNLAGALFAMVMLHIANEPADEDHPFGHSKAEYFSSGFEGTLIFVAAGAILWTAIPRLTQPAELESLGVGLWFSAASTALNLAVSRVLSKAAARLRSVALDADARHLMTDVWTSTGVIVALLAVPLTGWQWLDAAIAIVVAIHILFEGWRLMRSSAGGLMDEALPPADVLRIHALLDEYAQHGVLYSALKTRNAGSQRFVNLKVLVPGDWRVDRAHDLLDEIELRIGQAIPDAQVTTHLEPLSLQGHQGSPTQQ
ncbi:cation diffusion facilitator family transporter [Uliginosibacterium sp. H3]|uniref:Cation diffusion facilitator family transporter n=1 Tax=Uliginosibacterium silvisoli TaxID=3114758 RepID=A0ABU6K5E3_9RHOO|nr:cation diffusion facilitator family transporter [Uliginosibacterium sp. H3]